MSKEIKVWLTCPSCQESFVHFVDKSGKHAGALLGAGAGLTLGSKVGLGGFLAGAATGTKLGAILGPIGMAAGVVGGGVLGLVLGKNFGDKFDKPQCPKCGIKFSIETGMEPPKRLEG